MSKVQLKKGEIYHIDLGDTKGSEVKKVRPCIIVQNDIGNKYAPTTIIIPITHRKNNSQPTQVEINKKLLLNGTVDGMALAEQIRTVDRSRIIKRTGELNKIAQTLVDKAILISMGIA